MFDSDRTKNDSRVDASVESELDQPERGTPAFVKDLLRFTEFLEEENDELDRTRIADSLKTGETVLISRPIIEEDNFLNLDDIHREFWVNCVVRVQQVTMKLHFQI